MRAKSRYLSVLILAACSGQALAATQPLSASANNSATADTITSDSTALDSTTSASTTSASTTSASTISASTTSAPTVDNSLTVWASPLATSRNVVTQPLIHKMDKTNVATALSLLPGVILQQSGNRNELSVRLHGFDSRQVAIFYDGVPVYVPYDGNLDLGRLLTTDLASLEVSSGYTSLLQGPNQMGGAINLTTKKPQKPLEASVGYRQGFSNGEDNVYDANASLGMRNDIGYLQISGSELKRRFTGLPHGVNNPVAGQDGKRANSASNDKMGMVKIGFTPRVSDEYTLTYINEKGKKDSPPYAGSSKQKPQYWQWPQYDKESYYYQGITHLGDIFTLKTRLYHDTFKNTLLIYRSLADLQNKKGNYSHYDDYSNGAGIQLSADLRERDQLAFALHWKQDVHQAKDAPSAPYDIFKDRTWSLASEYQWGVVDNFDIVAGISYDWRNSLQSYRNRPGGNQQHYPFNKQHAFNWQVMGKYTLPNQDIISLSYSDRGRFPTLKERYQGHQASSGRIVLDNPYLKPERAHNLQLGYQGAIGKNWVYSADIYYNQVDDAIVSQDIDDNTAQNRNSGRVDYQGLDVSVQGNISRMLSVGANYSLIHSKVKRKSTGKITGLPASTVTGWLTFTPWQPLSITFSEQARSSSYSRNDGSQKAAGFAISNLRVDYKLPHGLSVNASVDNLFDTIYQYSEGFIDPGRSFHLGVQYKF